MYKLTYQKENYSNTQTELIFSGGEHRFKIHILKCGQARQESFHYTTSLSWWTITGFRCIEPQTWMNRTQKLTEELT